MRGLQLELGTGTHFLRLGKRVTFLEPNANQRAPDLNIADNASFDVDVECKSIGEDTGRKVTRREACNFAALLRKALVPISTRLNGGLSVVLTVPDRLPENHKGRVHLVDEVKKAILAANDANLADGSSIRIGPFDVNSLELQNLDKQAIRRKLDEVSGTRNRSTLLIGVGSGVLAITIQSMRDDNLLTVTFATLATAASAQPSVDKAGMLIVGFDGLSPDQLESIGLQDSTSSMPPTALRVSVSEFLESPRRQHLVGVGILSRSEISPSQNGVASSGGITYYFPNRQSPHWTAAMEGLFRWQSGVRE